MMSSTTAQQKAFDQRIQDPIEIVTNEAKRLPSFPDVLLRLDEELRKEDVNLPAVAQLVSMEPVLSGQILRLANSSWYNRGGTPIQDLTRAVIRLGLPNTKDLVHALLMPSLFQKHTGAINLEKFWKHSFAVALFAQAIGRRIGLSRSEMDILWTAGLLHDIGALIFEMVAPAHYRNVMELASAPESDPEHPSHINFCLLEQEWLGGDHAGVGAAFLEKIWMLPPSIVLCVRYHENLDWVLDESAAQRSIIPIHIADVLCEEHGVTWTPERAGKLTSLDKAWERLGLDDSAIAEMVSEVDAALEKADLLLNAGH